MVKSTTVLLAVTCIALLMGCGVRNIEEPGATNAASESDNPFEATSATSSSSSGTATSTDTAQVSQSSGLLTGSGSIPEEIAGLWVETWDVQDYIYIATNGEQTSYIQSSDGENCYRFGSLGIKWVHLGDNLYSKTVDSDSSAEPQQAEITTSPTGTTMAITYTEGFSTAVSFLYERTTGLTVIDMPLCE